MPDPYEPREPTSGPSARRRPRWSVWTILAPLAAIILWISFFSALGKSCVFKECRSENTSSSKAASGNDLPRGARAKVKSGDSLGAIASRYQLSEDELKACNPLVDPQALQPGAYLVVSAVDCEDADKAETGANPDPLAGDTAAVPNPADNGTAAADPSTAANAPTSTTGAEAGDEG